MFETIVIVYILGNLLSSRIFSFNKFVNNLDITKVSENFTLYSEFLNENNDQLIAGNLKIIKNNKLHKLFSRGYEYRDNESWEKVENESVSCEKLKQNTFERIKGYLDS